ncbi:MAG: PcfJ domain-containing protein [Bacillota bacterium]
MNDLTSFKSVLTEHQLERLDKFYTEKPQLLKRHSKEFIELTIDDPFTKHVNEYREKYLINRDRSLYGNFTSLHESKIDGEEYIVIHVWYDNNLAFYKKSTGELNHYHLATWKSSFVTFFINSNSWYNCNSNPFNKFYESSSIPSEKEVNILKKYHQFAYIPFFKLERINYYLMLLGMDNKSKLWQIEMLLKADFIRLASDLASTSEEMQWDVFKRYTEFFRLRGKGIYHYKELYKIVLDGFKDPAFIYLDNGWDKQWIKFLAKYREINRDRFIKYIKNRKSSMTKFGISFLDLYWLYLNFLSKIKLDLSRNKYTFPEDLEKEMYSIMLIIDIDMSNQIVDVYRNWQKELPIGEQDDRYKEYVREQRRQISKRNQANNRKRKLRMRKREEELAKLWDITRHIKLDIDEQLVLIAPTSADDLYVEGKTLNHCVYSYLDRIADKETMIFFLRKKDYQDKPFYTVEIKNNKLIQIRTTNQVTDPVIRSKFEAWMESNIEKLNINQQLQN